MIKLRTLLLSAILTAVALPTFAADICRAPVIDGTFSTFEWANAVRVRTGITTPEGDTVPGEIWITNDRDNIYFAIRHSYARVNDNSSGVTFDVNHSSWVDAGDDVVGASWSFWGDRGAGDSFYGPTGCPECVPLDTSLGGTNDITAGSALAADGWFTTEIAHPITGADSYDVKAAPGQYLGLLFSNRIFNAEGQYADTNIPLNGCRVTTYRVKACGSE